MPAAGEEGDGASGSQGLVMGAYKLGDGSNECTKIEDENVDDDDGLDDGKKKKAKRPPGGGCCCCCGPPRVLMQLTTPAPEDMTVESLEEEETESESEEEEEDDEPEPMRGYRLGGDENVMEE